MGQQANLVWKLGYYSPSLWEFMMEIVTASVTESHDQHRAMIVRQLGDPN